ncbi:DUF4145 domain-containing protein [Gordonia sp. OPL2]|nr:DUF4145 domain-containing protein [Gordonia sp. OPL2]
MWIPSAGATRSYADVPRPIADSATEAFECHSRHHYRASILLARAVIEATAKDKGISKGVLAAKIDEMFTKNLVREHIKDGAHSIRDLGNEMAHGDFAQPVTEEDSQMVIALMEEILVEVYQSPAKVAKAKAAVAARKQQSQGQITP